MTTSFFTLEQMDAVYKVEQDWLFEKLLGKPARMSQRLKLCTII
jgi:hypothetical protein